ncbi:MAG: hypothetical protein R3F56_03335 [Planctomycetota bacterium]
MAWLDLRRNPRVAALVSRRVGLACALLMGCSEGPPEVALPAFAASLPGNTVVVVWRVDDSPSTSSPPKQLLPWESALAPLPGWLGLSVQSVGDVARAWVGAASEVAWPSLAGNALFVSASAEAPPGERRAFVDLQQAVDLALTRASQPAVASPWQALQGVMVERVASALAVRSLQWLLVAERGEGASAECHAVVASAEGNAGVFGLLAERAPEASSAVAFACGDAALVATVAFVPRVAVGILRDLMAGEGDGALQMARELLRGPRFDAALAAVGGLAGGLRLAVGRDGAVVVLDVADARAVGDALDVVGRPEGQGWSFAGWHIVLEGATLVCRRGDLGAGGPSLPALRPGAWVSLPATGIEATATHVHGSGRVHVHARRIGSGGR